jgi:hypothetical protein
MSKTFNGVDFGFNARLAGGLRVTGGTSTGRYRIKQCFVIDDPGTYLNPNAAFRRGRKSGAIESRRSRRSSRAPSSTQGPGVCR